jgi:alpha-tubulin suppressor-like RCC1 family protein
MNQGDFMKHVAVLLMSGLLLLGCGATQDEMAQEPLGSLSQELCNAWTQCRHGGTIQCSGNASCTVGDATWINCDGAVTTCPVPTSVAAGLYHTVALQSDGTVWAWGRNTEGQAGDGIFTPQRLTPVRAVVSNVTAIATGDYHTVALKNDGTVWTWGWNSSGQLGDGTTSNRFAPVQVAGLSSITAIAAGTDHTVAVKSDGTVWAWGNNSYGKLGDGTFTYYRLTPVQVPGLSSITAITAGADHTVARKSDGTVWAWGLNAYGQLGDGTSTSSRTPVQVVGLSSITAIAAGRDHTIARRSDGTAWAWGHNSQGQVGDGTTAYQRTRPVQVVGLSSITAIAAGTYHTVARRSDGTMWAWGANSYRQLGDGTTAYERSLPVQVVGLSSVTAIEAGFGHTVALKSDGRVWDWGHNFYGQLGDGTTVDRPLPVQVVGL